jgi:hypothetical protein
MQFCGQNKKPIRMPYKLRFLLFIIVTPLFFYSCTQNLNTGDLLFVVSEKSDFEKSIAEVTKNNNYELNFTHVVMVNVTDSGVFVVEAVPEKGVIYSILVDFESTKMIIGKLKPKYQKYASAALSRACSHLGKGYDYAFDFENDLYYCSKLVYDAFVYASGDPHFFETPNMTFKKEGSDDFLPYWIEYFEKQDISVPEGKPGINPNGLSRSEKLRIIE